MNDLIYWYRIPEEDREGGIGIWIHIFKAEDMWFKYSDNKKEHNSKRKLRFNIMIDVIIWHISIRIPLKHVGNVYYGRKMKD